MTFTSRFRSLTRSFSQFNLFASRFCPAAGTRPRGAVLRLHPGLACLALIPAVLLLSASASAQVTYTGTAATQNFGSQAVGSASAAVTLNFSVAAATTVGSIGVLTQGAPNLDFTSASGGTCAAQVYASATTCTVNVSFKPGHPGVRMGAVVFFSDAGNTGTSLGQVLIYGTGTGPLATFANATSGAYLPSATSTLGRGFFTPWGVAVDASGNVFVVDEFKGTVKEIVAAGGYSTIKPLGPGFDGLPQGVAVDGAGDVFVTVVTSNDVIEILAASGYKTVNRIGGLANPSGLAVDGAGNVFVADEGDGTVKEILAAGGYTTINTLGSGFGSPFAVAVDGNENVFIASELGEIEAGHGAVYEMLAAGGYSTVNALGSGFDFEYGGLAVDAVGNVFFVDDTTVKEIVAAGGYATIKTVGSGFNFLYGVALDGSGNVFVTGPSSVYKLDFVDQPNLNFPALTEVGSIDATDSPQTVTVSNNGNNTLVLSALAFPPDFPEASGDANACTSSTSVGIGQACDLPIEFLPQQVGTLSEAVTLTDNALNVAGTQQSVAVSGTGYVEVGGAIQFSVAAASSASVVAGTPFSITVTALNPAGGTATAYNGTVSFTSSDAEFVNPGPLTLVGGIGQATVTLQTAGTQTITATDTTTASVTGTGNFNVGFTPILPAPGTPSSSNFGSRPVGSTGAAQTLSFSIPVGTTVGSIAVFTQGAPNLDFAGTAGSTCAAQEYSTATTCTVNVAFNPKYPGLRMGAVVFFSEPGNAGASLGQLLIYGTGTGPQATFANTTSGIFLPSSQTTLASGFNVPIGLAVDGSGNVFVADAANNAVKEILAANGYTTIKSLGSGFLGPLDVAVDGAGNIFVIDGSNYAVKEILAANGYTTVKTLVSELDAEGVTVDGSGNVFVTVGGSKSFNDKVDEILATGGYTTVKTLATGFNDPGGVAVDASGNIFVADYGNNAVKEIVAAGGYTTVKTLASGFINPNGVAVDASGNIFVADVGNNAVKEIVAASGYTTVNTLGSGFYWPFGVAVDSRGNVFVAVDHGQVYQLDYTDPPSLTFGDTAVGFKSTRSPQTVTVSNDGNAELTFPVPGSGNNPALASGYTLDASTICPELTAGSAAGTLAAGTSCTYAVDFIPVAVGADSGALALTDNSLNASSAATQAIQLTGTAVEPHLAFTTKPQVSLKAGYGPGTVTVSVESINSDVITTSSATVTLTVTGPNGYSKTYTATAQSGVATFSSLASLNVPGSYSYAATDAPDGFTQAVASETVTAQGPFGKLDKAEDSVTFSSTVGQSGSVKITGWVADPQDGAPMSNVKVYIDGTSIGTPTLGIAVPAVAALRDNDAYLLSGYQMLYPASSLSVGTHQVTVIAIDSLGLSTTFGPVSFTVAAAAGVGVPFGVLSPAADSVTSSTTVGQSNSVNIQGWVGDPQDHAPLTNVTVYIDGASIGAPTLGIARPAVASLYGSAYLNSGYQLLHPASSLSLGSHSVTVIATDAGGRSTTFGPVTFTVAAVAGAGSPFGILGEAVDSVTLSTTVSQSDSVKISGWVIDRGNTTPITNVTVYIDGTSIGTPTLGLSRPTVAADYGSSYRNSGYQMLYPASSLSQGAHSATVVAIDSGDRSTTFGPVEFTVQ